MKHKQNGSAHIILIGMLVVLITGALTYIILNKFSETDTSKTVQGSTAQPEETMATETRPYVSFEDWKVRFPSNTTYILKRNSETGSHSAYFISVRELTAKCVSPDTPWLGIIQRFDNPEEKQTIGPDAGKTMNEIFGSKGMIIDGKLYYFDTTTQFCTRNTKVPEIEQAAETLENEIKFLVSY